MQHRWDFSAQASADRFGALGGIPNWEFFSTTLGISQRIPTQCWGRAAPLRFAYPRTLGSLPDSPLSSEMNASRMHASNVRSPVAPTPTPRAQASPRYPPFFLL